VLEDPGCPYFTRALSATGARIIGVPVDESGLIPERLPASADLLLVGPSWAYPLGGVMPMRRRREVVAWARRTGAVVVEHDWAGTVRFEGGPMPAMETLDAGQHVIYAGGFSEVVPSAQVAFAIVPTGLRSRVETGRSHLDVRPSLVDQRTLAHFIADGHLETHLRRLRVALAARRQQLSALASSMLAEVGNLRLGTAGMQAILSLADGVRAADLASRAEELQLDVAPLSEFSLGRVDREGLVLDYSSVGEADLRDGLELLRQAWQATVAETAAEAGA
jgi:GntR family transcriptional regulator/MocR family aminotransferase